MGKTMNNAPNGQNFKLNAIGMVATTYLSNPSFQPPVILGVGEQSHLSSSAEFEEASTRKDVTALVTAPIIANQSVGVSTANAHPVSASTTTATSANQQQQNFTRSQPTDGETCARQNQVDPTSTAQGVGISDQHKSGPPEQQSDKHKGKKVHAPPSSSQKPSSFEQPRPSRSRGRSRGPTGCDDW